MEYYCHWIVSTARSLVLFNVNGENVRRYHGVSTTHISEHCETIPRDRASLRSPSVWGQIWPHLTSKVQSFNVGLPISLKVVQRNRHSLFHSCIQNLLTIPSAHWKGLLQAQQGATARLQSCQEPKGIHRGLPLSTNTERSSIQNFNVHLSSGEFRWLFNCPVLEAGWRAGPCGICAGR